MSAERDLTDVISEWMQGEPDRPSDPAAVPWILHIEDDVEMTEALKMRLEKLGVAVVRAFDGMDGYRQAFRYPADAIILDIGMPNGNGDYVLQRLKDNPVTREIPVIVLTGRNDRHLERRLLNMGACRFFSKPLAFADLLEELRQHVDLLAAAPTGTQLEQPDAVVTARSRVARGNGAGQTEPARASAPPRRPAHGRITGGPLAETRLS